MTEEENRIRLLPALAVLALLAACEEVPYCELCLDNDPARPVPAENVARIRPLHDDRPLPASAAGVHIYERCGIDCSRFIRFDAALGEARAFVRSLAASRQSRHASFHNGVTRQA